MSLKKITNLNKSLLFRLTILYAGIFTVSALLVFSIIYYKIYAVAINEIDEEFLGEIDNFTEMMDKKGMEAIRSEIMNLSELEDPGEEFHRVIAFDGKILASTQMSTWDTLQSYGIPEEITSGKSEHVFETLHIHSLDFNARIVSAVIAPDTVLQIGETLEEAEEYFQIFINWFLLLTIFVVIFSSLVGWYLARRALRDMENVTETAMEISNGMYDKRVLIKDRFIEIKRLGDTFNKMLDQLHTVLQSMREINDNIAHDLRSPLARIRGTAELGLMTTKSVDEYKDMCASTIEECDDLIEIINTMLDITEIESGSVTLSKEKVEIVELITHACDLFRPVADGKKISITTDFPDELVLNADKSKLQRIVSNFIDNAIKYTREGGAIKVYLKSSDGTVRIIVEDNGIGIAEEELPHIFERFYRCDVSRTEKGVGLGLSLAKALTQSMNGFIQVQSSLNEGSAFIISLPLSASP